MHRGSYCKKKEKGDVRFFWLLPLGLALLLLGVLLWGNGFHRTPEPVQFTAEDAALVHVKSNCGCEADAERLLLEPLRWNLAGRRPKVLIIHTHACESYTRADGEQYTETEPFRTRDEAHNMIAIGDRVAEILQKNGIAVIHDKTLYDDPSYADAYDNARQAVQKHLKDDPEISLVLDLHRDAAENADGSQWGPTVELDGEQAANVMLVIGTGCGDSPQPHWKDNLSLAVKMQAVLERCYPGLCREIELSSARYNQDLFEKFLLIEIGAAGNTRREALTAAEKLAEAILALSGGAN